MHIVQDCYEVHSQKIDYQAAIGLTLVREDDTIETIIARAGHYMFEAKKSPDQQVIGDYSELN